MEVVRIACIDPPDSDRSRWSRELLLEAIGARLAPVPVPAQKITSFTATLSFSLAASLKKLASECGWTTPHLAAGLIEAARLARTTPEAASTEAPAADDDAELSLLRKELRPLFKGCLAAIAEKKIPFAEAATGTGKGRMIALLAARAARAGQRVVVTAPLPITWQLAETLTAFEGVRECGVAILLGRANFASPDLLQAWATEHEHADMLAWIEAGGPARDPRAIKLQERLGIRLNWLLDDALGLADELEPGMVMLEADDELEADGAEQAYQLLQASGSAAGIVLCSHHFLAAHIRRQIMWTRKPDAGQSDDGKSAKQSRVPPLPEQIDLLLVDEAHLLEPAFASIFSQSLFLKPLERLIERSLLRGRRAVLDALDGLNREVLAATRKDGKHVAATGTIDDFERAAVCAQQVLESLDKLSLARQEKSIKRSIHYAKLALKDILSGHGTLRLEVSPVRHYPQIMVGRANLEKPLGHLWAKASAAVLVSATLYTDGVNAGLTRWKLAVPTERAVFLPSITPPWVTEPVRLRLPAADALQPDDSPAWITSVAESILTISAAAVGGMLVLCTSYQNAHNLTEQLLPHLGDRLIAQNADQGASTCAAKFRQAYAAGLRPVWIGVGSAWTGIDLHDPNVEPAADNMLTDLVITRLPLGVNRTLTHERRAAIAGFNVVVQEAVWHLRQGIGRLVRREGGGQRNLWMLDPRLIGKDGWASPFRQALRRYRQG